MEKLSLLSVGSVAADILLGSSTEASLDGRNGLVWRRFISSSHTKRNFSTYNIIN